MWERIPVENWQKQAGHVDRYRMAAGLLREGDVVLDVACGIGYGAAVLNPDGRVQYVGVDRDGVIEPQFERFGTFETHDLDEWTPQFGFDVAVCFETLEHLRDPWRFVEVLKLARRSVMISVPTVPTKHFNPYHLHDFTVQQIIDAVADYGDLTITPQPSELSHIFTITK